MTGGLPPGTVRDVLDQLHRAVFEDMIANGTPRAQIPVFEQRVRIDCGSLDLDHLRGGDIRPDRRRRQL